MNNFKDRLILEKMDLKPEMHSIFSIKLFSQIKFLKHINNLFVYYRNTILFTALYLNYECYSHKYIVIHYHLSS